MNLLGLFPYVGTERKGGIELSGRLAWEGMRQAVTELGGSAELFCYNAWTSRAAGIPFDATIAYSKPEAIAKSLRRSWHPELILVWHMALLKLLPFFRAPNARLALFLHGTEAWRTQDLLTNWQLSRVDLFMTNTDYTWQRFLRAHPRFSNTMHKTVYLGLDVPAMQIPAPRQATPIALVVSRLPRAEIHKGHQAMIRSWRSVLQRIPAAELWVAGEGGLRVELEELVAALGLETHIRFFGGISEAQKQTLLGESRCFAMPSIAEGFGLVYAEAMRLGRPCLVSTMDAGQEVVNPPEAGLAVNPDDFSQLADALCRLLTLDDEWHARSANARRRYEQNFTAAHFQNRLKSVLLNQSS